MNPADPHRHRRPDCGATQDDVDDGAHSELVVQQIDRRLGRPKVNDVVEGRIRQFTHVVRACHRHVRTGPGAVDLGCCDDRHKGRRLTMLSRLGQAHHDVAVIDDHQQPSARGQRAPVRRGVGVLDACPRLHQRHGRRAGLLGHGDQRPDTGGGVHDNALVHQDVLLETALEVVPEGGVGTFGGQCAVVGLHKAAFADPVVGDFAAHRHNPARHLVSRHGRQLAGHVARDLLEHLRGDARHDLPLAGVGRELVQQLEVREAQTNCLDLDHDLMGAGLRHVLAAVEHETSGSDQLDGTLGVRESVLVLVWCHRVHLA